jgi:hypothetical protein
LWRLNSDLTGDFVASLADTLISSYPSQTLRNVNSSLDAWLALWNTRQYRDGAISESKMFMLDPLPFWWLAKLYLLLHCAGEDALRGSEFANPRAKGLNVKERIAMMVRVMGWLRRFRRMELLDRREKDEEGSCLPQLIHPVE